MKRQLSAAVLAVGLTALAACGSTQPSADEADESAPSAATGDDCATSETADEVTDGPISITDDLGRTVELDGPATRVVSLEWQQTEDVLTLCVNPVAVADVEAYGTWDTAAELPADTVDVGTRQEPSLDAVFAQNPDLIIVEPSSADDPRIAQLEEYGVPVLASVGADAADPIGKARDTFTMIAEALGKQARAEEVLAQLDASLEEGRAAIEAAAPETTDFVYVDAYVDGSNVTIRPFGQGALMSEVGEELGLTNAWTGEVDPVYGLGATDVEGLVAVEDATVFYTDTESSSWLEALEDNAVWTGLDFVANDRLSPFPEGIWTFGGPRSIQQMVDAYVAELS